MFAFWAWGHGCENLICIQYIFQAGCCGNFHIYCLQDYIFWNDDGMSIWAVYIKIQFFFCWKILGYSKVCGSVQYFHLSYDRGEHNRHGVWVFEETPESVFVVIVYGSWYRKLIIVFLVSLFWRRSRKIYFHGFDKAKDIVKYKLKYKILI